ncbi:unnamed protein product, partial [Ectocarpus sp. 8 AP-2014]
MVFSRRLPAAKPTFLLFLAIYCAIGGGFLLPSSIRSSSSRGGSEAVSRSNMIQDSDVRPPPRPHSSRDRYRSRGGYYSRRVTSASRQTGPIPSLVPHGQPTSHVPTRMQSADGGEQTQQEELDERTVQRDEQQTGDSIAVAAATVADGNSNEDDGSDTDDDGTRVPHPLPKSLGGGRYLVQSLLGTGSTASTYRCTTTTTLRRQRRED